MSAGQKAYQSLKAYQRFKTSQQSKLRVILNVLVALFMIGQVLVSAFAGEYLNAISGAGVIAVVIGALQMAEATKQKNFELLRQLKAKYGPEIYDAIKAEPASLQYRFLQKTYPRERETPVIELP